MMKANSPSWAREKPAWTAVSRPAPEMSAPARQPLLPDDDRVHHHADRDEEDCPEEVLDLRKQMFNPFPFKCFCEDGTHHEGAEGRGESDRIGDGDHQEAEADGHDEEGLVVEQFLDFPEDGRDQVDAHQEPDDEEKDQPDEGDGHLSALETAGDGQGREEDHEQHGDQVLDDEAAEDQRRIGLVLEAHVVVGLDDDGGGGHGQETAEEDAFHRAPAHDFPEQDADDEHADAFDPGHGHGTAADLEQLLEAELQPQGEEQEDDADLRPLVDGLGAGQFDQSQMGPDHESGDDVAEDQRLLEGFGKDGEEAGRDEDDGEVLDEIQLLRHAGSWLFSAKVTLFRRELLYLQGEID